MMLDKFGVHISKYNADELENKIYLKLQNKLTQNLQTDEKYIENEIIQSVNKNVNSIKRQVDENNEQVQYVSKKIKLLDELLSTYDSKILSVRNDFENLKKEIREDTTVQLASTFTSFQNKINDIKKDTDEMKNDEKNTITKLKHEIEINATAINDINKIREELESKVADIKKYDDKINNIKKDIDESRTEISENYNKIELYHEKFLIDLIRVKTNIENIKKDVKNLEENVAKQPK